MLSTLNGSEEECADLVALWKQMNYLSMVKDLTVILYY
jgi:hypothetical protein